MRRTDKILGWIFGILAFALTIVAAVVWTKLNYLSIPLSTSLALATTCLPFITVLSPVLVSFFDVRRGRNSRVSQLHNLSRTMNFLFFALVIYSTSVLALTSTSFLNSQAASCRLDTQWRHLFQTKNAAAIRAIQDALQCCGFRSTHDKAWPFEGGGNKIDACVTRFERTINCEGLWRGQERILYGLMTLVGVSSLVGQLILIFYIVSRSMSLDAEPANNARSSPYSTFTVADTEEEPLNRVHRADGTSRRGIEPLYSDDAESGNGTEHLPRPDID